jgi:PAS domain S-box-containing protein
MEEKARVLIVDDDRGSCESLGDIFMEKGYHVETANTGHEAIERIHANDFEISLIDIKLPDILGIELLKKLKSLNPDLICIMITGYATLQNAIQAIEEGANGFFMKPLVIEQVLNRIDEIFEKLSLQRKYLQSQERYQFLFEESPAINLVIGEDGVIKDANKIVMGYRKEQLLEKPAMDFVVSQDREKALDFLSKNFKGEKTTELEIEAIAPDGSIHTLLFSAGSVLIEVDHHRSMLLTAIDITDKKYMQKFQELTTQVLNLLNRPEDMTNTIRKILLLIKQFTGFEAIGIRIKEGDDFPYYQATGFSESFLEIERFLGARDSSGNPLRDSTGDPILECMCGNILCGRFDPCLPFFTQTGSFWTNCLSELLASTTEADHLIRMRNLCNAEGYESIALIPLRSDLGIIGLLQINDKRKGMFSLHMIQLFEVIGSSVGIALVRRQAEEEIQRLNAELEQRVLQRTAQLQASNKELQSFAYSIAHDLRAPLRAIEGFSQILKIEYNDIINFEGKRLFGIIHTNIHTMDQLITDLLEMARVTHCEIQPSLLNMVTMVNSVYQEIASHIEQKPVLTISSLLNNFGDPSLIKQVWRNLLSNAMKFTLPKENRKIEVGSYTDDGRYVYYIRDNGVGFDSKYTHKLFGVFQRLHTVDEFEGNGVGLAIVKRIIQRHGGRVWAEGKVNEGATFYFALPINLDHLSPQRHQDTKN